MARARNLKPGLFKNEVLGVADPLLTLLFEGLWLLADRAGRLEDRPLRIKGELFPYRDGISIDDMLSWLQANGFIRRYSAQGGKYIEVLNFGKHQNPHKNETESEIPAPEEKTTGAEEIGTTPEKIGSTRADSLSTDSLSTDSPLTEPSPAGRVCRLMKSKGISDVSPGNPDLVMLIEAGATDDEFIHAAEVAVKAGKRFSYALGVVKGKRKEAAEDAKKVHRGPMPRGSPKTSYTDQQREQLAKLTGSTQQQTPIGDFIDV